MEVYREMITTILLVPPSMRAALNDVRRGCRVNMSGSRLRFTVQSANEVADLNHTEQWRI